MLKKKQNNIVFIDKKFKPSRFLVDLPGIENKKEKKKEEEKKERFKYTFNSFNFKKYLNFFNIFYLNKKVNQLAFFSAIKYCINLLYKILLFFIKICYKIGWIVVFLVRFLGIVFIKFNKFKIFFLKNKNKIKFFSSLKRKKKKEKKILSSKKNIVKQILIFAGLLFLLTLPFKGFSYYQMLKNMHGKVFGDSVFAANNFVTAAKFANEKDFKQASQSFSFASNNFNEIKNDIKIISNSLSLISEIIPNNKIKLASEADSILTAGKITSDIGNILSLAFHELENKKDEENLKDIYISFQDKIKECVVLSEQLNTEIQKINLKNLPIKYQNDFLILSKESKTIVSAIKEFSDILNIFYTIFGMEEDQRYLVVFQNNAEVRASGGFIGSFALVDFRNGKIKKMEVPKGGSYDIDGGLYDFIKSPEALRIVNPRWYFRDANWWPDWSKSAEKLMSFYEKSGGSTVDGVISITPTVIESILEIIGPIDLQNEYGVVITAENFFEITQTLSEQKPKNHPEYIKNLDALKKITKNNDLILDNLKNDGKESKKIINDTIEIILDKISKITDKDIFLKLIIAIENSLQEKHILMYFADQNLQENVKKIGWAGAIIDTAGDYLMVINTNIAGGKSDKKIKQTITHNAKINKDGSIIDTVRIKRVHTGIKNENFYGVRNNDWMRIYVPLGSKLLEVKGFSIIKDKFFKKPDDNWKDDMDILHTKNQTTIDIKSKTKIYNESNKTVFANWIQTDPGETSEVIIKYLLPFKLSIKESESSLKNKFKNFMNPNQKQLIPYSLLVQKQPGFVNSDFKSVLNISNNFKSIWKYPESINNKKNSWDIKTNFNTDKYFATLLEIK